MQIVVLVNPKASKTRAAAYQQLQTVKYPGLELIVPSGADYLAQAQKALAAGAEALLVIGGDGTINDAAQLIAGTDKKLLIVPAGTGNDFASGLRIHKRTSPQQLLMGFERLVQADYEVQPVTALQVTATVLPAHTNTTKVTELAATKQLSATAEPAVPAAQQQTTPVNSAAPAQVQAWAINSVNVGFDALVNRRALQLQHISGGLRYLVAMLLEIPKFKPLKFTIQVLRQHRSQTGQATARVSTHRNKPETMSQTLRHKKQLVRRHRQQENAWVSAENSPCSCDATLVCIQNGPFIGGGIPLALQADSRSSSLWISVVGKLSRPGLLAIFPLLYLRAHRLIRPLRQREADGVNLTVPAHVPIYLDGDALLDDSPQPVQLSVTAVPGALQLVRFIPGHD